MEKPYIDLITTKIKQEYLSGDIVMSELLRYKTYSDLPRKIKYELLVWAGEDDLMRVDIYGNIVERED